MGEHRATFPVALAAAVAAISLGVAAESWLCPAILIAVLLLHAVGGVILKTKPRFFIGLLILIPYAIWWRYSADRGPTLVYPTHLFLMGFCLLSLGIYYLLCYRNGGSVHMAHGAIIFAFALSGTASENVMFNRLLVIFVLITLWQLRHALSLPAMKFGRSWITRATILLIVLACTLATQNYVVANFPTVGRWINNRVRGFALSAARGFDDTARLGSIRGVWMSESGQQVMLRVWSDQLPGYLRGALFDAYLQGTWAAAADSQTLEPADTHHGRNVFSFTARQPDRINGHVYADSSLRHVFFLPLGTHQISSFADSVNVARGWTARPNFPGASGGYGYYQPVSPMRGPTDLDLAVPPLLQSKLQSIADQIVGDTAGPAAIIKRIEQHFHQNYEYEFNMELRTNKDPVIEFLEDKDAGYCEYFASAATLLLRTQDIPARYVTGFVAHEPSLDNNYWIARNRDAHAWVEAYLPDQGWVIVEPTTPAARPQSNTPSTRAQFADWFAAQWQRLLQFITRGGLGGMIAALWDGLIVLMTQIIPLWAWGVLIAAAALWSTRSRIRKWWARKRAAPQPPHILALQRKLTLAQNLLDPHGLTLAPGDTVADYLDAAAAADIPEPARIEAVQLLTEYQHDRFHPPTDDSPPAPDIG